MDGLAVMDHLLERRQRLHRAMRHPDIEFMWAQHPWLENDCLLADIILPVNTKLEEDDIAGDIFSGQYQPALSRAQVHRAAGRSRTATTKSSCMIAERLGLLQRNTPAARAVLRLIRHGWETSRCAD